jgi:hypothetical protein
MLKLIIFQYMQAGWKDEELSAAFNGALVVGQSLLIPRLHRAVGDLDLARSRPA